MANGDAARDAGLPVVEQTDDARLGFDSINALADYLAAIVTTAWRQGINTTKGIATTGDVNANGKITTNRLQVNADGYFGQLAVAGQINANGAVLASEFRSNSTFIAGSTDLLAEIVALKARLAAAGIA